MALTALARFRDALYASAGLSTGSVWLGWFMALSSSLAFSIATPIAKGAIDSGLNPTTLLTLRLILSTLLLGLSIGLTTPGYLRLDRKGLLVCGIAGLSNGIGMLTYFWALARLDGSLAVMIFAISPLVTLAFLAARGERFTRRHFVRLGLGLVGVYLLIGPSGKVDWWGVTLVMVTVCAFAVHLALIQWYLQPYNARTITFYVVATMMVVNVGLWLTEGGEWRSVGWSGWFIIAVLALISTYLARLAMFEGVRRLGGSQVALLLPLETLLAVIWSVVFLGERLNFWEWAGGGLILLSALLAIQRLNLARWQPRWRVWSRL
jgi:drug/metabolite transporter (DMT)-like permease